MTEPGWDEIHAAEHRADVHNGGVCNCPGASRLPVAAIPPGRCPESTVIEGERLECGLDAGHSGDHRTPSFTGNGARL